MRQNSLKYLNQRKTERKDLIRKASTIDKESLEKYASLVSDLRQDSSAALFSTLIITIRRCSLLYMAMFVVNRQWLHVLTFMVINDFSLAYIVSVKPFESDSANNLGIFNEVIAVCISYFILQVNNPVYGPEDRVEIGKFIVYIIYAAYAGNGLVITLLSVREIYAKILSYYRRNCRRKPRPPKAAETVEMAGSSQKEEPEEKEKMQLESISEESESISDSQSSN